MRERKKKKFLLPLLSLLLDFVSIGSVFTFADSKKKKERKKVFFWCVLQNLAADFFFYLLIQKE